MPLKEVMRYRLKLKFEDITAWIVPRENKQGCERMTAIKSLVGRCVHVCMCGGAVFIA
jgi:hypothetical protein